MSPPTLHLVTPSLAAVDWSWLAAGIGIGLLAGAAAAWVGFRRQLQRVQLAERRARSAERLAELGSMTGGLAHEIKNPLSTLGLNAQLLGEGISDAIADPEPRARLLNRVGALRRETERLKGILSDFLAYAGEVRLDQRATDLNTIVDELADFFRPECERVGVRLRADLAPAPVLASVDAKLLKQALLNLMLNAVQAMSPAPPAASTAAAPATAPIPAGSRGELILKVGAGLDDRRPAALIHVIDTGPGIPPDALPRVFTPYFTTKAGGTGLGLPTTRRIIEAHGGQIDVFSQPGTGTDFMLTLPASTPPMRSPGPAAGPSAAPAT